MNHILTRDAHRLLVAPFLGLLAGFLVNRARNGDLGYALMWEMVFGALVVTVGGVMLARLALILEARAEASRVRLAAAQQQAESHRLALIEAETERYHAERLLHEQTVFARNELVAATERIARLEADQRAAREAGERLAALEAAQESLRVDSVHLSQRAAQEAEELKASLRQLAITDSQRERNMAAPDNEQSGRIIELEARIRRLAREIERLSTRHEPAAEQGQASLVQPGGTSDKARIGFLKAMLDANKTLREQIREAA